MRSTEKYQNSKNTFKRQLSLPKMGKIDLDTKHTQPKVKLIHFQTLLDLKGKHLAYCVKKIMLHQQILKYQNLL